MKLSSLSLRFCVATEGKILYVLSNDMLDPSNSEPQLVVIGKVSTGEGVASSDYGIPTANLDLEKEPSLDFGVYAVCVKHKDRSYAGALCYGAGEPAKFEVHLLDFRGDLNGDELSVEILEKVSELVDFGSKERMRHKILHDIQLVRQVFAGR